MSITFQAPKIGPEQLRARLDRAEKVLRVEMSDAVIEIVQRTQSGKGMEGGQFAKSSYSKGYERYKKSVGRNTSPVDLTLTGGMLAAIQHKVVRTATKLVGQLFFTNTSTTPPQYVPQTARGKARREAHDKVVDYLTRRRKSAPKSKHRKASTKKPKAVSARVKAAANQRLRPFFGLSEAQRRKINQKLRDAMLSGYF